MIKLKDILSEKFNVQPGQVVTFKDMPPFKTPSQIKEEENSVNEADDHEVGMGLSALKESVRSAKIIYDEIKKRNIQELEGWVQHKLTLASDYLNTVAQYMEDLDEYDEKDDK